MKDDAQNISVLPNRTAIPETWVGKPDGYPAQHPPDQIHRRIMNLLGPFRLPEVPLNVEVTDEKQLDGGVVCQRVEYATSPGERIAALHLFRREMPSNAPGVLAIHAHGGEDIFPIGKQHHANARSDDPSQYAYRAALSGFRVIAPDALCFGERKAAWGYSKTFMHEVCAHMELVARGKSLLWKSLWDNSRALEVLQQFGSRRLGLIGHSGGSTQGYILAALHDGIEAAACFGSFATLRHQFYQYRLSHCLYHYVPGMVSAGIDWDQVVALAAPRKLFFGWGAKDAGTPEVMYRAFVKAIKMRCISEGFPSSVEVYEELEYGHDITETILINALQFLHQNLHQNRCVDALKG